jgi:molybdopterin-guanine dinucleotide biosynthesis protein A
MIDGCAAVVMAGGRATRLGGVAKGLVVVGGETILERQLRVLRPLFAEIRIVANDAAPYARFGLPIVGDRVAGRGPLGGLEAALGALDAPCAFVCACDMPLLQIDLVADMIEAVSGYDAVVPRWHGKIQPLCGLYNKRCMNFIDELLKEDHAHCAGLFDRVKTRFFLESEVVLTDPKGLTFLDVDTPEDFDAVKVREM